MRRQSIFPLVFHHFLFILLLIFNIESERMALFILFCLGKAFSHSGMHTHMELVIEVGTHRGIERIFFNLLDHQCTLCSDKVWFQRMVC